MRTISMILACIALAVSLAGQTPEIEGLKQKAEAGDIKAQANLGFKYAVGSGVSTDMKEAAKWYRMAAEQGDTNSQTELGIMYRSGEGVQRDIEEAVRWFRMAAELGHSWSQYELGECYLEGYGIEQDYKEAYFWSMLAVDRGRDDASNNRYDASRQLSPEEQAQIKDRAKIWHRSAAENGDYIAQVRLAESYHKGEGVEQDKQEAYFWWILAAAKGGIGDGEIRDELAKELTTDEQELVQARAKKWLEEHP